jgi:alpha-glucosidase
MYFPRGNWYDYWDHKPREGGQELWVDADLDSMPIFIKEGAIIPKYPVQQFVGEKDIDQLKLDVFYKLGKETSEVYEDAHDGYDYMKGRYSLRKFKLTGKPKELIIQQHKEGKFFTDYTDFEVKLIGLPFKVKKVQVDNENIPLGKLKRNGESTLIIDKNFTELHIFGK